MTLHTLLLRLAHPFNRSNRVYASGNDPWRMARAQEQYRFEETNRLIEEHFPAISTIIEYGSGEGHQTEWLAKRALVHGVEVSPIAVERARKQCPYATFETGSILDYNSGRRFDLATGFECLWYVPKNRYIDELERLERAGRNVMVSYYQKVRSQFDPIIDSIESVEKAEIHYGDITWTVAWWPSRI